MTIKFTPPNNSNLSPEDPSPFSYKTFYLTYGEIEVLLKNAMKDKIARQIIEGSRDPDLEAEQILEDNFEKLL